MLHCFVYNTYSMMLHILWGAMGFGHQHASQTLTYLTLQIWVLDMTMQGFRTNLICEDDLQWLYGTSMVYCST